MPQPSARSRVCNVLVIGAGAAGLRAAIAATEAGSQVLIVGKRHRLDAHTVLAAGGINAVLGTRDPQDPWEQHFADTLREGYFLGHPRVVEIMAREAPDAVRELAAWGCRFATLEDGRLDQRFFGAHKYRRTCYAGDYTGRAILYTLANKVAELGMRASARLVGGILFRRVVWRCRELSVLAGDQIIRQRKAGHCLEAGGPGFQMGPMPHLEPALDCRQTTAPPQPVGRIRR